MAHYKQVAITLLLFRQHSNALVDESKHIFGLSANLSTCYNLPLDWLVTPQAKRTTISEDYAQIVRAPIYIVRVHTNILMEVEVVEKALGDSTTRQAIMICVYE